MTGTLYLGIGFLLVFAIIGIFIFLTRKNPVDTKNKTIIVTIAVLQVAHILIYFTGILEMITKANVYAGFIVCVVLSLLCLALSVWISVPPKKCRNAIKYLFLFLSVIQVLITIWMFMLPEAGIPPLIQF